MIGRLHATSLVQKQTNFTESLCIQGLLKWCTCARTCVARKNYVAWARRKQMVRQHFVEAEFQEHLCLSLVELMKVVRESLDE